MAPDRFGRTILYATGYVNSAAGAGCALKALEKPAKYHGDVI
jgi:hypothetical protein